MGHRLTLSPGQLTDLARTLRAIALDHPPAAPVLSDLAATYDLLSQVEKSAVRQADCERACGRFG